MTLRELVDHHDAFLLERWDHTASTSMLLYNLTVIVSNITSKSRAKGRQFEDFHPFRKKKRRGMRVNAKNFGVLRTLGNAIAKG